MGLNVYFCDVCGVRVTDVDLRSGHGMLRGQDVICATCLEQGHGKEWLASRGVASPVLPSASVPLAVRPVLSPNPVIDHARDRARTVEDRPASAVALADEDTGIVADRRDDLEEDEPSEVLEPTRPSPAEEHASARSQTADLSGAASGFAALGPSTPVFADDEENVEVAEALDVQSDVDAYADADDAADAADAELEEFPLKPLAGSTAGSQETDEVVGASAFAANKSKNKSSVSRLPSKSRSDRLRRSVSGARPGGASAKASSVKRSVSSSSGQGTKTPPSSAPVSGKSSASSRIAKPKSGRSKRSEAVGGGMPLPLKISLITIPLILIIALASYVGPKMMSGSREPNVQDLVAQQKWIETEFSKTKATINSAVDSKDLKTLQSANAAWLKFNDDFDRFCKSAKQYSKWTDDNCDTYSSQTLKLMDVSGRMKVIRDEIVKQQMKSR